MEHGSWIVDIDIDIIYYYPRHVPPPAEYK